jgi:hypothetical protein
MTIPFYDNIKKNHKADNTAKRHQSQAECYTAGVTQVAMEMNTNEKFTKKRTFDS